MAEVPDHLTICEGVVVVGGTAVVVRRTADRWIVDPGRSVRSAVVATLAEAADLAHEIAAGIETCRHLDAQRAEVAAELDDLMARRTLTGPTVEAAA